MPTTLSKIEPGEQAPIVSAFSSHGFTLRGLRKVMGSVALLPKGFFHWRIDNVKEITPESMTLFTLVHPKLGTSFYK